MDIMSYVLIAIVILVIIFAKMALVIIPQSETKIIERPQKPAEEPEKLPPWLEGTIMHETTAGWNSGWIPVKDDTAPQPAKAEIRHDTMERIRRKT